MLTPKFKLGERVQIPMDCEKIQRSYRGAQGIISEVSESVDSAPNQYLIHFQGSLGSQVISEEYLRTC